MNIIAALKEMKKNLLADGIIDAAEVETIKTVIYEDGKIDDDEADYLYDQIKGDGQVDDTERALLENMKSMAKIFPEKLASFL